MNCDRMIGPYPCCSVVQGDCLELMKALPDGCVDAVITDPPYNFEPISGGICGKRSYQKELDALDICSFTSTAFLDALPAVGSVVAFCNKALIPEYLAWATAHRLSWDLHAAWKDAPIPAFGSHYLADAEYAVVIRRKGATWLMDAPFDCYRRVTPFGAIVDRLHPAQKPQALMERYIRVLVDKGAIVVDPYCGSGSTLVAAKKLGRHFLGFEISEEYFRIARERIARVEAQPNLFEPKVEQVEMFTAVPLGGKR